jgi:hypothetical protein
MLPGETEAKKFYDYQMHPLYMRMTDVGREVWGSAPVYFPLEGTSGDPARTDLYTMIPLPVLPTKNMFPGDSWQAQQVFGRLNMDALREQEKLTVALQSRGTFLGVEWERGIPCAKFNIEVDAGPREIVNAADVNNQPGEATRVSMQAVVWFALDRGIVVRSESSLLQESLVTVGTAAGGAAGGGTGATGGPDGGKQLPGGFGPTGSGGGGASRPPGGFFEFNPFVDDHGQVNFFRQRGTRGGIGGGPMGGSGNTQGGTQGPGLGGREGGGSGGGQKVILRIRETRIFELER